MKKNHPRKAATLNGILPKAERDQLAANTLSAIRDAQRTPFQRAEDAYYPARRSLALIILHLEAVASSDRTTDDLEADSATALADIARDTRGHVETMWKAIESAWPGTATYKGGAR
jgi:hypothetical protein